MRLWFLAEQQEVAARCPAHRRIPGLLTHSSLAAGRQVEDPDRVHTFLVRPAEGDTISPCIDRCAGVSADATDSERSLPSGLQVHRYGPDGAQHVVVEVQ